MEISLILIIKDSEIGVLPYDESAKKLVLRDAQMLVVLSDRCEGLICFPSFSGIVIPSEA